MRIACFVLILLAFLTCPVFSQENSVLVYGKSDIGVLKYSNRTGTPVDAIAVTAAPSTEVNYEFLVSSVSGTAATVRETNLVTKKQQTKVMTTGAANTAAVSGFTITLNDTVTAGNIFRFSYSYFTPMKTDSTGKVATAKWESARVDSISALTTSRQSIVFTGDFEDGITVLADVNLMFRTNRITNWISLAAGNSIYIPIRHVASDTFYCMAQSAIPNVTVIRGN